MEDEDAPFPAQYVEGLRLFNNGYYWHAHEALEDVWNEASGVDRECYQGVIQVAAACFHIVRANWSGADRLLHQARKNLSNGGARWRGLDLVALDRTIDALLDEVHAVRHAGKPSFDLALVPVLVADGGPDVTAAMDGPPSPRD